MKKIILTQKRGYGGGGGGGGGGGSNLAFLRFFLRNSQATRITTTATTATARPYVSAADIVAGDCVGCAEAVWEGVGVVEGG
jgi:hypothetical protein